MMEGPFLLSQYAYTALQRNDNAHGLRTSLSIKENGSFKMCVTRWSPSSPAPNGTNQLTILPRLPPHPTHRSEDSAAHALPDDLVAPVHVNTAVAHVRPSQLVLSPPGAAAALGARAAKSMSLRSMDSPHPRRLKPVRSSRSAGQADDDATTVRVVARQRLGELLADPSHYNLDVFEVRA